MGFFMFSGMVDDLKKKEFMNFLSKSNRASP